MKFNRNGTIVPTGRDDTYDPSEVHRKSIEELFETAFSEDQRKVLLGQGFEPGSGLSDEAKKALLACFEHVAWADEHGQEYYQALKDALGILTLDHITAVFTQRGKIYSDATLDSLKSNLVVTAFYTNGTSERIQDYELTGTLESGDSTIIAAYEDKTAEFTVEVTPNMWLYHFNGNLNSSGNKDFGFTGVEKYVAGRVNGTRAYDHFIPTPDDATTDPGAIAAVGLSEDQLPNFNGDFTISFWMQSQKAMYGHGFTMTRYKASGNSTGEGTLGSPVAGEGFPTPSVNHATSRKYAGFLMWLTANGLYVAVYAAPNGNPGTRLAFSFPSGFDTTQWHHYAITRDGNTLRFFVDGQIAVTIPINDGVQIFQADQICLGALFTQTAEADTVPGHFANGERFQDFFILEACKWKEAFDPLNIVY